jgi:hypothetical protein
MLLHSESRKTIAASAALQVTPWSAVPGSFGRAMWVGSLSRDGVLLFAGVGRSPVEGPYEEL